MDEARALIAKDRPSVAILEHDPPYIDGMEMCRAIREQENDQEYRLPVIMVATQEDQAAAAAAGVTDWLIKPFTDAYARTKVRAWALRAACQPPVEIPTVPMAQKGIENRRHSENVITTDKSALLWMYCREIAPFETPAFSKTVGDLIVRATKRPQKCVAVQRQM
jgi:DNA-binding response OmpR family regulator